MFGMSSTDFWENDPQLYWAYRTFYLKKLEMEGETSKYNAWLNGNTQSVGTLIALKNGFSKNGESVSFPSYDEMFGNSPKKEKLSSKEVKEQVQNDFNYWARR
jgi:hypothetical protein